MMDYEEAAKKYSEDGYAIIEDFLSQEEIKDLKQRMNEIMHDLDPKEHANVFSTLQPEKLNEYFLNSGDKISFFFEEKAMDKDGNLLVDKDKSINKIGHALHSVDPVFAKVTQSEKVKKVAKAMKIVDPVICQSMYIFKQPRIGGVVKPHQDSTFMRTRPDSLLGFWIPLEDAKKDNSCLWVIPGSHKEGVHNGRYWVRNPNKTTCPDDFIFTGDKKEYKDSDFVPCEMKAGSLLLIHGALVHSSEENVSERSRHAYAFHLFEGSDVKYCEGNWLQPTEKGTFVHLFATS